MEFSHVSVLYDEVMEYMNVRPGGIYVDGTLGGAGHASGICERMHGKGTFVGIDQDADAISAAGKRLESVSVEKHIVRDNYVNAPRILKDLGIEKADGILLDIGVSSYQFNNGERGFSYRFDAPLDMRMDQRNPLTAETVVNTYSQKELFHIIRDYGEESFAENIAKHIVMRREESPIRTTGELAEIISQSIPMKIRKKGGHPAKKTFQAIRIEVNKELDVLSESIDSLEALLNPGGRLLIITFHSLEDRIVKRAFKKLEDPCICPPDLPVCVCGRKSHGKMITRKPVLPSEEEIERNPRSRSAKLRVFEHREEGDLS
ncbi:MAG: 16S rRNA (cytosine(1402)-N(4))-methyltransferase RsmH [Lachnospiraceae bacterium]|jgi:16S rRNA (cytosine1402-N4)-methyltransferase|nr:16S rRNA (cytosine(1402)-N(4))-methyltransferase RsmH [Lachnospiraceae bacterium]